MMEEVYIKTEQIEIEIKLEKTEEGPQELESNLQTDCVPPKTKLENDEKINETNADARTPKDDFNADIIQSYSPTDNNEYSIPFPEKDEVEINGKVYENGKINRLSCSQCDKTFKNRANLKNHLKYVHSGNHSVECPQCFRSFKSHGHLRSHLDSVHAVREESKCHICDKVFLTPKRLKNHIYYTHPQPTKQATCTVCFKTYKSHYNLKVHMKQVHPDGHSVSCPYCDKSFKVDMLLQRHIKWTHPNDGMIYKCQQCFKILPSLGCYKKHVENTHNTSLRVTCQLCKRVFKTKKTLDRHVKNLHIGTEVKTYIPSKFTCSFCDRGFESNTTLFWHTQKYHLDKDTVTDPLICEICNKTYADNASMQRHLASVHSLETATCNICFKEFKSAINLQCHIRITHAPPEATQTCEICQKTFKCPLHLRMHTNAVHTIGEFTCEVCDKTFTSSKYLNKHKKTHIDVRDHPCELCDKKFKSLFAANKHMRNVHNGVKCNFCHIKQAKIKEHLLKCPKRDEDCFKCGKTVSELELYDHILSCGFEEMNSDHVKIENEDDNSNSVD